MRHVCLVGSLFLLLGGCGSSGSSGDSRPTADPGQVGTENNYGWIYFVDENYSPLPLTEAMGSTGQEVAVRAPLGWEDCCSPEAKDGGPTVEFESEHSALSFNFKVHREAETSVGDWFLLKARGDQLQYRSHALGLSMGSDFPQTQNTYFPEELNLAFGMDLSVTTQDGHRLLCEEMILAQGSETATKRFGLSAKDLEDTGIAVADGDWIDAAFDFAGDVFDVIGFKVHENNWWAAQSGKNRELFKTKVKIPQRDGGHRVLPAILLQCSDSETRQIVFAKMYQPGSFDNEFAILFNLPPVPAPETLPPGSWICSCNLSQGLTWDGRSLCAICGATSSCASGCSSFVNDDGQLKCDDAQLPPGSWICSCDSPTWDGEELCATCGNVKSCASGCSSYSNDQGQLVCDP